MRCKRRSEGIARVRGTSNFFPSGLGQNTDKTSNKNLHRNTFSDAPTSRLRQFFDAFAEELRGVSLDWRIEGLEVPQLSRFESMSFIANILACK